MSGLPLALMLVASPAAAERLVDLVRPIVGTARKDQAIGAVNSGQTFPAVGVPFGMTHWTPQTQASEDKCVSPFYAQDERIQGIRASHWWSGSCTQDYGSVTIAATTGPLRVGAEEAASTFSRADEVMTPAYYAVTLADHGVRVEVTGTARAGILRLTFLREGEASVLVRANRKTQGAIPGGVARVDAAARTICVSNPVQRIYAGSGRPAGFSGHLWARVEAPFEAVGTWSGTQVRPGAPGGAGGRRRLRRLRAIPRPGGPGRARPRRHVVHVHRGRPTEPGGGDRTRGLRRGPRAGRGGVGERPGSGPRAGGNGRRATGLLHGALPRAAAAPPRERRRRLVPALRGGGVERGAASTTTTTSRSGTRSAPSTPCSCSCSRSGCPHLVRSLLAKGEQGGFVPNFPGWNSYTSADDRRPRRVGHRRRLGEGRARLRR